MPSHALAVFGIHDQDFRSSWRATQRGLGALLRLRTTLNANQKDKYVDVRHILADSLNILIVRSSYGEV